MYAHRYYQNHNVHKPLVPLKQRSCITMTCMDHYMVMPHHGMHGSLYSRASPCAYICMYHTAHARIYNRYISTCINTYIHIHIYTSHIYNMNVLIHFYNFHPFFYNFNIFCFKCAKCYHIFYIPFIKNIFFK